MLERTETPVRVSDVVCAMAEYWYLLNDIPSHQTQFRVCESDRNLLVSIVAPDVGFEWSVIVPRNLPGRAPKHIEIMHVVFHSLSSAIQESFPPRRGSSD